MRDSSEPEERHITGIDGCRALACLGVFVVNFMNKVGINSSGSVLDFNEITGRFGIVTLIVLSGFGLSIPFWQALNQGQRLPAFMKFWGRRFLRIAPLYYLCLLALIINNQIWAKAQGWTDISLHFLFLYNYSNAFYYSMNPVFWVLAYFMHFYLVLPILFLMGRRSVRGALIVMIAAMIISYLLHSYLSALADERAGVASARSLVLSKSFLAYLPHFLLGTLAGWFYACRARLRPPKGSRPLLSISFWLLIAWLVADLGMGLSRSLELPYSVYHFPAIPVLIALLVLCAALGGGAGFLESKPMRLFALLSYGIFVFHYPVINLTLGLLPRLGVEPQNHALITAIVALIITSVIAAITYLCIEKPIRAISGKFLG